MILPYCAICSSPIRILPLKTPLPVLSFTLTLTLTLTLLHLLSHFTLSCPDDTKLRRSTPVGAMGPPREKTNSSANADFQPTLNKQEAPPTTVQSLASRFYKLEKMFTDEIATYTSITAGIHSQYFFLYDKIRQLEPGTSDVIICKIPSVKFVFESAKVARPSSDHLIEPATSFSCPIFRTHPHGFNFFIKFYSYGNGPANCKCASRLFTLSLATMAIFSSGPLKAHPHWYSRSIGPIEHLDGENATGSRTSIQKAHNVNKN